MKTRASQSWIYPKGKPTLIFFENGKRVSLKRGFEMYEAGEFNGSPHIKSWFEDNGFCEKGANK